MFQSREISFKLRQHTGETVNTQKNITIGFIAMLTLILIWVVCNHREQMKVLEISLQEMQIKQRSELGINTKKGIW